MLNSLQQTHENYIKALQTISSPCLFLDLDAFEANRDWVLKNAGDKTIRVATKSLRSVKIIRTILESSPVFRGLMTYTLPEALHLRSLGFRDLLMGYPTWDEVSLKCLARDPSEITLMVDLPEHLKLLEKIAAQAGTRLHVCVDLDLSMELPGLRFGVYRSALNTCEKLREFLSVLRLCSHLELVGAMGYEAQIAGVGDRSSPLVRFLQKVSVSQLRKRRKRMVELLRNEGHTLRFVNGGGTGSLQLTSQEEIVTEITVGSAFYAPWLFDHYRSFSLKPAMGFTLPVVRAPLKGVLTAQGGGYVASGSRDPSKLPKPYLPEGIELLTHEGAGEVQTPFRQRRFPGGKIPPGAASKVGDLIFMRHAKAGEPCERFNEIHLIRKGVYEGKVATYRGEGKAFT
ncbi:MAG: alanine racemase [Methylotenera sp.]|nr:alanine racemase [Oligoflexia bacterium]